eukprot:COSAG06_NODE_1106_length_10684_cov_5.383656_3_plen_337_part_00
MDDYAREVEELSDAHEQLTEIGEATPGGGTGTARGVAGLAAAAADTVSSKVSAAVKSVAVAPQLPPTPPIDPTKALPDFSVEVATKLIEPVDKKPFRHGELVFADTGTISKFLVVPDHVDDPEEVLKAMLVDWQMPLPNITISVQSSSGNALDPTVPGGFRAAEHGQETAMGWEELPVSWGTGNSAQERFREKMSDMMYGVCRAATESKGWIVSEMAGRCGGTLTGHIVDVGVVRARIHSSSSATISFLRCQPQLLLSKIAHSHSPPACSARVCRRRTRKFVRLKLATWSTSRFRPRNTSCARALSARATLTRAFQLNGELARRQSSSARCGTRSP